MLGAHVAGARQVVDDAGVGGAGRGDDREQSGAIVGVERVDHRPQGVTVHATTLVGRHPDDVGVHHPGGLLDRRVGARRRDQQASGAVVGAARVVAPLPARGDERAEVAGRAAADEHAAGLGRQAGEVGDPPQRLVLGERRAGTLEP